jgi:hypothetical protein
MTSSTVMVCVPYFIPRISPTSSHARKSRSISFLVCEEDRQNRTRELISGVALFVSIDLGSRIGTYGYATTTTTIGVLSCPTRSNIICEKKCILAGEKMRRGIMGESR